MFEHEARLRELSHKSMDGSMTDTEFAELTRLSLAKKEVRDTRATRIATVVDTIKSHGISMLELFSAAEVLAAVPRSALRPKSPADGTSAPVEVPAPARKTRAAAGPETNATQTEGQTGTWVRQKRGVVLVEVKKAGVQGLPCRYCQGQRMSYYVPPTLKALDDGNLEANLDRHTTDAGHAYFATEEGRVEREQLLGYIRSRRVKGR